MHALAPDRNTTLFSGPRLRDPLAVIGCASGDCHIGRKATGLKELSSAVTRGLASLFSCGELSYFACDWLWGVA
ncbi:hypothetical protein Pla144_02910 [Bythopirellula polymerisocia]|uniref:Uncharacterized protein n=1 Tax=Bythopirellula polymerisocia TaxID=2528003 RepID=A0A5C6CX05_9BACT|nr:hypothetical protein Pla144_02910 [Bythopirellula polymerisocia]